MTEDQLRFANKLMSERNKIKAELEVWEKELSDKSKMAYLQSWNNNHATKLDTKISADIFNGFRAASMNDLALQILEIDREIAGI